MMKDTERRSHSMLVKHWQVIDTIAEQLGTTATTGSRVGLPSWRSLLYQIATGKLTIVSTDTLNTYTGMLGSIAKAINYLVVAPASLGAKRHILARLRAARIDPDSGDG